MQAYSAIPGGVLFLENHAVFTASKERAPQLVLPAEEGFSPVYVSVNNDCTLLALASTTEVRVYLIESENWSFRRLETLNRHTLGSQCKIVSLTWHPSARTNAGLVVLTSTHIVLAHLQVGKPSRIEKKELKDSSSLRLDPAGITFGAADSPLGNLTAYLGTKDGDIYRIFPFIPLEAEVPSAELDNIKKFVDLKDCSTLFESWSDEKSCRVTVISRHTHSSISPIHIGDPLLIKPYAEVLYAEETLDLKAGSVGWATDLVVQSTTNFVNFYASPSPLSDRLVGLAFTKFAKPQTQRRIELITPERVFINCGSTLHVLDIGQWSSELQNAFETNIDLETGIAKPVTKVTSYPARFLYCNSHTIKSPDHDETWDYSYRAPVQKPRHSLSSTSDNFDELDDQPLAAVQGDLNYKTTAVVAELRKETPHAPLIANWGANLGSLEKLNTLATEFNRKIVKLARAMAQIQLERTVQKREMKQQCSDLYKLKDQVSPTKQSVPRLQNEVDSLMARQSELSRRMRQVATALLELEIKQPERKPSKAEQMWVSELKNILPRKLDALTSQIEFLKSSLAAAKLAQSEAGGLSSFEDRKESELAPRNALELHWRLKKQSERIDSLKHTLDIKD